MSTNPSSPNIPVQYSAGAPVQYTASPVQYTAGVSGVQPVAVAPPPVYYAATAPPPGTVVYAVSQPQPMVYQQQPERVKQAPASGVGAGGNSDMVRRIMWVGNTFFGLLCWIFILVGISTGAIISCNNNITLGYWAVCSGSTCNNYTSTDDATKAAEAFAILSILSITAVLVLLIISIKNNKKQLLFMIAALCIVNFIFNLLSLAIFTGDVRNNGGCYNGLGYSGGLTVTAMIFEVGIAAACVIYAAMGQTFAFIK